MKLLDPSVSVTTILHRVKFVHSDLRHYQNVIISYYIQIMTPFEFFLKRYAFSRNNSKERKKSVCQEI